MNSTLTVVPATIASPLPSLTATSIPQKILVQSWTQWSQQGIGTSDQYLLIYNSSFRCEVLTNFSGDTCVKSFYAHRPDILDVYLLLTVPILKADFLCYLILLAEGSVWSDIDVSARQFR
jgi:mannosyltransferase OCH1-like enzyme